MATRRTGQPKAHAVLARRAFAELLGSLLLAATVVGSGIAAQRLSPSDAGLQLLENALITGAVLVALILALGPVSAAFNPVVTLAERAFGAIGSAATVVLIAAQVAGCCLGVVLANLMFDLNPVTFSTHRRSSGGLWLGEVVATFGLLVVIFGVVRSGRAGQVGYAVGGYITAAYWFTSSTSFANPAITVGRPCPTPSPASPPPQSPVSSSCNCSAAPSPSALSGCSTPTPGRSPSMWPPAARRPAGPTTVTCAPRATTGQPVTTQTPTAPCAAHRKEEPGRDRQRHHTLDTTSRQQPALRTVRLRPQRRPLTDGRRLPHRPGR